MDSLHVNHNSARSAKARLAVKLDAKLVRILLRLIVLLLVISWLFFMIEGWVLLAHLMAVLVTAPLMLLIWFRGELSNIKPLEGPAGNSSVDAALDPSILGRITPSTSPQLLSDIVAKLPGGRFFAARYAISMSIIRQALSDNPEDLLRVWQAARVYAQEAGESEISSFAVVAGLVRTLPDPAGYLAALNLDETDLVAGLRWSLHIKQIVEQVHQPRFHGGLGRDLNFGWAPLLNQIGYNITASIQGGAMVHRPVASHDRVIDQMIHLLSQPGRRNATLVGEVGVGKTTTVYAMAARLLDSAAPPNLRYNQIVTLDPASLIANAKGRGQLEELLIHLFNEAIKVKNIILFLDNAELFLKEGTGSVDLSNILLPVLEGGAMRLILSLDEQEWLRLGQTNPGLAQLMNRVVVKPLDVVESMQVIEDQSLLLEGRHKVVYMHNALKEAYKLADRYIREQAMPGKAIKLLESAAGFAEQEHFITARSVQQAVEKSFDVKVQTASSFEEKDILLNLEDRIHQRMVNQTRAVKLVSDALRRARAGVRNENRPIGTFLFLGPTGVGKTELSKALGEVYFGGEDRLVRVDLNEFSQSSDTSRLLAAGATDAYSLSAQISKQPFSVVLLDEIEKAHPNVLNLLLQMLDEGILRDADNKPVSFRDAIIIATSNAGADRIRQHIDQGEQLEQFEEDFVNELIDSNLFRPEFINRFDEVVLFRPLSESELAQIVDLQILQLNKRLGAQKIAVSLTDDARQLLVSVGHDPRLGARPLRRTVQRAVENLVAQKMLQDQVRAGETLHLTGADLQSALDDRQ